MRNKNKVFLIYGGILFLSQVAQGRVIYAQEGPKYEDIDSLGAPYQQEQKDKLHAIRRMSRQADKISFDFKGMDIVDVLKTISQKANFNIVIGKNVTGKVTIFLKEVNIWEAFETILSSNNLAYDIKGQIIYIMTDRDYELSYGEKFGSKREALTKQLEFAKVQDLSKAVSQVKSSVGSVITDENTNTIVVLDTPERIRQIEALVSGLDKPLQTRIYELKYSQADKISAKIQEAVTKNVGSIRVDERTNKIAVTDYPSRIAHISRLIEAFDEKPRQVRIDAQIIEISPEKDEFKMGVDWDVWISKNLRFANSLSMSNATKLSLGTAAEGISLGGKYDKKGVLDLLQTIGKTKILSSPSIMALNNQEAKILVGTKEAYITSSTSQSGSGTATTSQEVNFVDVGIKLYVTPTINKDGYVTMKIKPEVSSSKTESLKSEDKTTQVPIVTTSEAETTVTLQDGATIIIGGLKKDKKEREIKKIPFLGDIPILGAVFRSVSSALNKSELVIFITPHIVSDDNPPEYVSLTRDSDILRMLEESQKTVLGRKTRKPNPPEPIRIENTADYYSYIRDKIFSAVEITNIADDYKGEAVVLFMISSDGRLEGEPEILAVTSEELKDATINVVKSVFPLPAFPRDMAKSRERFQLSIVYD